MATLCTIDCRQCGQRKQVSIGSGQYREICHTCEAANDSKAKAAHLTQLAGLPIEARLRKIEEWSYDYRPQYVEPPRF